MNRGVFPLAAAALAVSAGSALAQSPPPLMTWTGFYIGANAGYTWSDSNWIRTEAATVSCLSFGGACNPGTLGLTLATASALGATGVWPVTNDGFIGGGQAGYNWQFAPSFVAGVELDFQGIAGASGAASASSAIPIPPFGAPSSLVTVLNASRSIDYLGTVRGRLGFLFTPTLLLYGTAGFAYGGARSSTNILQFISPPIFNSPPIGASGAFSETKLGWAAGGGGEWRFAPNWSVKIEYLHYDLGSASYGVGPLAFLIDPDGVVSFVNPVRATTRFNGNLVRAGVNYHF